MHFALAVFVYRGSEMKRFLVKIVLLLILLHQSACATIYSTCSFDAAAKKIVNKLTKGDIVFLDIDRTIVEINDPFYYILHPSECVMKDDDVTWAAEIKKRFDSEVLAGVAQYLYGSLYSTYGMRLVEDSLPFIISFFIEQGVNVIAVTSTDPGAMLDGLIVHESRFESLDALGIDLSGQFDDGTINFSMLEPSTNNQDKSSAYPTFYKGMFLVGKKNKKSRSILEFIKHFKLKPARVAFFDDHRPHVEDVSKIMEAAKIECDAFWYLGSYKKVVTFDRENIELRLKHLIEKNEFCRLPVSL